MDDDSVQGQGLKDLQALLALVEGRIEDARDQGRSVAVRRLEEIRDLTIQTMDSLTLLQRQGEGHAVNWSSSLPADNRIAIRQQGQQNGQRAEEVRRP
jgi:hypothetical protein